MPRVVVILPSQTYRAADFVDAASTLGIDLTVASENPPPMEMGDRYLEIDCADPAVAARQIVTAGNQVPIDGIVAADDGGVVAAALAAEELGLVGNPPQAARATRDKLAMRRLLARSEVDQPVFAAIEPEDHHAPPNSLQYPVVVKPRDRSASQGVIRADNPDQFAAAVAEIREIIEDDGATLIAESYMPGAEIAVEGLIDDGNLRILAIFDKPDTSTGPYFPETIFVTPSELGAKDLTEAQRVSQSAVTALGLHQGPVHIEVKIDDGRARVIEVAARSIGGLCSRSLSFGLSDTSLESLILRNALNRDPAHLRRERIARGVLMVPTTVSGTIEEILGEEDVREIEEVTGIDWTYAIGDTVAAPPRGDRYVGFVYARSADRNKVHEALSEAKNRLKVVTR